MARAHRMAAAVEEQPRQERLPRKPRIPPLNRVPVEQGLHGLEHLLLDQSWLLALVDAALVGHLAEVEAVAQDVGQRSPPDRRAPAGPPVRSSAQDRADAARIQLPLQSREATQLQVAAE